MNSPFIIDAHTHIFDETKYKAYRAKAKERVSRALVLHWFKDDLNKLRSFIESKDDLALVASVDIEEKIQPQLDKLEKLFQEKKIVGIKLYPGYQHFYPSDKRVFSVAELCEKYGKPLIFHSGDVYDPRGSGGKAMLKYSHPIHIDELATQFPDCKIVIAHFGFPYVIETANVVSKNDNVYTEISGTIDEVGPAGKIKALVEQYADDLKRAFTYYPNVRKKTMFGTDYGGEDIPLNQFEPYIELVKEVFSSEEQENVFSGLAKKVFF